MKLGLKKTLLGVFTLMVLAMGMAAAPASAYAATSNTETSAETVEAKEDNSISGKALAAALVVGLAATGGAIGMGITSAKANEGISRQPEAEGKIRSSMMLGLVFIETAIIYALIVAILIIFVM